MSRWFVLSFLVICLVCLAQAFPQAPAAPQPTPAGRIEAAVNNVMESLNKGLKDILEDPGLNQLVKDSQAALANAAEALRNGAEKIMPNTGDAAAAGK